MRPPLEWSERGEELGATLDICHAVVVVGSDPVATADVALGIAKAQGAHRRVAIVDLIGDAPPLQALVSTEDTHGIVDSFAFGVSLNKIAYPVPGRPNLFIMPSGSGPVDHEELLPSPRWRRLTGGFREVGALLVLVAPANAARLRDLVDTTDGLIIVGDAAPAEVPVAQALAWLRPRRATTSAPREAPHAVLAKAGAPRRKRILAGVGGIAVTILFIAAMAWFARRPWAGEKPVKAVSANTPAAPAAAPILSAPTGGQMVPSDSIARDSSALTDSFPTLPVANPADMARASSWSVRLQQTNTPSAAILDLRGRFETVPAGTYGYNDLRTRYILLVAGAYPTRASAESLLVQLRLNRTLAPDNGSVISLPYAFLVQQDVPMADVPQRLKRFAARGKPVYALAQPNGAAHLYFGAYESPEHAALAVPSLRDTGLTPTLVYRIGRVF